jgi:hypothetical protein
MVKDSLHRPAIKKQYSTIKLTGKEVCYNAGN